MKRLFFFLLGFYKLFGAVVTNTNDSGAGSLRQAILDAASAESITFNVSGTITLLSPLPEIVTQDLTINGTGQAIVIDGASTYRPFFISSTGVTLENMTFQNCRAKGGDGGTSSSNGNAGGGGGMGAGGALFVNDSGSVTVSNITFSSNAAIGGNGGNGVGSLGFGSGGGGGLGGRGGNATGSGGGGGGGKLPSNSGGDAAGSAGLGSGGGGNGGFTSTGGSSAIDFGGGGGSGSSSQGGLGGYGGGGGGSNSSAQGGYGGFGGGGGGESSSGSGGVGGFGGGNGASNSGGGGGGAGFGGNIFLRSGGSLLIDSDVSSGTVTAGTGGNGGATNGTAAGSGIYLHTTSLNLAPSASREISGVIAGTGGITQSSGTSTTTLSATNTYTGATSVTSGTLRVTGSISTTTGVSTGSGATFDLGPTTTTTFNKVISGGGNFTKSGSSSLTLSEVNTYSGITTILGGSLKITGSIPNTSSVTNNGVLEFTPAARELVFSSVISGSGSLIKSGSNSLNLSGSNLYTGGTTLSTGTINLSNNTGLGSGALSMEFDTTLALSPGIAAANAISLANHANINVTSGTGALSGVISESASTKVLTKTGAGILILSNVNTYSGGTALSEGTIQLAHNNGLGAGVLTMAANTTLSLDSGINLANNIFPLGNATINVSSDSSTFSGVVSSTHNLIKTGSGTLVLSKVNTLSGTTIVSQGTLSFIDNGSLANSNVTIASGATLRGTGGVGSLEVNGTIAPGNSIGTITVNGDYNPAANSTYEVEINANGESDLISVTGEAVLNNQTASVYTLGNGFSGVQTYTILEANSISGTFNLDTSNITQTFKSASLSYTATNVFFTIEWMADLVSRILKNNPGRVARYLDDLQALGVSSDLDSIINVLTLISSDSELAAALNQLHAEPQSNMKWLTFSQVYGIQNSLYNSRKRWQKQTSNQNNSLALVAQNDSLAFSRCPLEKGHQIASQGQDFVLESDHWSIWGQPNYAYYNQPTKGEDNLGVDAHTVGATVGFEYFFDRILEGDYSLLTGLAANSSYTLYDQKTVKGDGDIFSYFVGPYFSFFEEKAFFLDTSFLIGQSFYDSKRHIQFASIDRTAKSDHSSINGSVELFTGYDFGQREFIFQPFAGFGYFFNRQEAYTERGANSLNLHVEKLNSHIWQAQLGVYISQRILYKHFSLEPFGQLSGMYLIPRSDQPVIGSFTGQSLTFNVYGGTESEWGIAPILGVNFNFDNGFFMTLAFQGRYAENDQTSECLLRLGGSF